MAAFELSKWYMDCVTGSGDASIAYTGTLRWGPVRLHFTSLLESTAEAVKVRNSLRPQSEPCIDHGSLRWRSESLGIAGEWQADSREIHETVFESGDGAVDWHCLMPRAQTNIHSRSGLGYAEHLTCTIAPWKLPIRTLRWGRFTASSEWFVWIDWQGDYTRRIVYRNGQATPTLLIEDGLIEFSDGVRLTLDRSLVLREGRLGATALSAIPGVHDTFPARLLQMNECKWRSRGCLERPGAASVEGWAIHERVDWPK